MAAVAAATAAAAAAAETPVRGAAVHASVDAPSGLGIARKSGRRPAGPGQQWRECSLAKGQRSFVQSLSGGPLPRCFGLGQHRRTKESVFADRCVGRRRSFTAGSASAGPSGRASGLGVESACPSPGQRCGQKGRMPSLAPKSPATQFAMAAAGKGTGGKGRRQEEDEGEYGSLDEDEEEPVSALPSPPAGFIVDDDGEVALVAPAERRLLTLTDPVLQRPLECVIRRTFFSESGLQFFLLYPLDVPILIFRINEQTGGLIEVDDEEAKEICGTLAYALAKKNFHLIMSGYVLTVRGAVCFSEDDVTSVTAEFGLGFGGNLSEGVEITLFLHKGKRYSVYTPFDPLLFLAFRDPSTGNVIVAESEEHLSDPNVVAAMEEEQEFQIMVEEEETMLQRVR